MANINYPGEPDNTKPSRCALIAALATLPPLTGEVFPTTIRGKGAGFAAAFAKLGAVQIAFFFPIPFAAARNPC